jgi:signal transduction histidine kinase
MTVARRLGLALGLHFLLLLALLTFHLRTIRHAVTTAHELSEVSANLVISASRQLARVARLEESAAKFAVTRDEGYLFQFDTVRAQFSAEMEQWATLPAGEDEARAIEAALGTWEAIRLEPPATGDWTSMRSPLAAVSVTAQHTMRARLALAADEAARATRLSWLAAAGALLLAVLTAWLLARSITGPLRRLAAGTREVAKGRFGYRLDTRRGDEFAQVADAFNTMTERLGALDRMKQDFVSSVSHDLKSPLASLRETTTLLLDGVPGPLTARQHRLLTLQRESADRLGTMIAKLLDLSRLEAGLPLAIRSEPLVPLLEAAVAHAAAAGAEREVRVALTVAVTGGRDPVLACDADRVRQLVDNLLENAVKFSPRGALVELSLEARDGVAHLAVADRGPGIAPELRDRVFERFYQTSEGRSVHGRGVGLGLTIVREIAHAHGGTIGIEGREGGGTVFRVRLPGLEEAGTALDGAALEHEPPAAERRPGTHAVSTRVATLALALGALACGGHRRPAFEAHLGAGRWTEAIAAFERDSARHEDPEALRRIADLHAVPQRPEWDPVRAAELYERARRHAGRGWEMPAASARSAALVEEVLREREERLAVAHEANVRVARVEAELAALRAERDSLGRLVAASDGEIAIRARLIARLERSLQEREAEARQLRQALERLKAIDLKPQAPRLH